MATGEKTAKNITALVLAAGSASRFGGGKLTAPYRGAPLLAGALAAARAAPVQEVILITGADADAVAAAAVRLLPDIRVVHAADHAEGLSASLRAGIAALEPDVEAAFVFLGDMPRVPHSVLKPLADAVTAGAAAAVPRFGGVRGNPVVLSQTLFERVGQLSGDVGARPLLEGLGAQLAWIEAPDDGVLFDVDERTDLDA